MRYPIIKRDAWGNQFTVSNEETWAEALNMANQLNISGLVRDTYFATVKTGPEEGETQ